MEAHDTPSWVLIAYLVAGVCFILALRGLSSPESSRRGNRAGMIGMARPSLLFFFLVHRQHALGD